MSPEPKPAPETVRRGVRRALDPLAEFVRQESASGVVLLVATVAALVWANALGEDSYASFWETGLTLGFGELSVKEDLRGWVNDGLMVIFFFVVGLEIKRELVVGRLSDRKAALLPVIAAVGGVILPALIFVAIMAGRPGADGWAIPMATDIAFAVGVLALLGDRVSAGVKLLLLGIAIVDDVIAISVIALFYSEGISLVWLTGAVAGLLVVAGMRLLGVSRVLAYVPVGLLVWLATLESGVHPTVAGVALALLTPTDPVNGRRVLEDLEHRLHPYSAFAVLPVFALANAGIALGGDVLADAATSPLPWAIAAGLVVGKLLGIAGAALLALRLRVGALGEDVRLAQVWGVAALGGIGFTVSLFVAQLAYTDPEIIDMAKIGIFAGSLISALVGVTLLIRGARAGPTESP
ncbi:MAG TPA: Na+/H+ antiporter NhaA [Solirubrobacteraceae bacterium]|nr:Na+/H+ antiporter NhaA [Solirubrobacteraceae bacterium]